MINRRHILKVLAAGSIMAGTGAAHRSLAARRPNPVNTLDSPSGAAIKGYDPVAYFVAGKPTPGKPEHAATFNGATWLFSSAENKSLFEQSPEKYVPAYGGYCAYGTSRGYLVKIEPEAWSIRNGRLYLNYDLGVRKQWERNPSTYIEAADKNWPRLVKSNP